MNTSFERAKDGNSTTTWLTPPEIIRCLGEFDLDPCCPENMPWSTARHHFTIKDDALSQNWFGRVWMNPPYGKLMELFLEKLALHGNGIALVYTRMETEQFFKWVFPYADAFFFKKGRIHFLNEQGKLPTKEDGKRGNGPGAGSLFVAYGLENVKALRDQKEIEGKLVPLSWGAWQLLNPTATTLQEALEPDMYLPPSFNSLRVFNEALRINGFQGITRRVNETTIEGATNATKGRKLNELAINTTLYSASDIHELINYLQQAKDSF